MHNKNILNFNLTADQVKTIVSQVDTSTLNLLHSAIANRLFCEAAAQELDELGVRFTDKNIDTIGEISTSDYLVAFEQAMPDFLSSPIEAFTSGRHYVCVYECEGELTQSRKMGFVEVCNYAAELIAFADCSDTNFLYIKDTNSDEEYAYCGWQPDMLIEFVNSAGKVVYSHSFPQWEH